MLNGIENLSTNTIVNYVSESLTDKIFEEIKANMKKYDFIHRYRNYNIN